MATRWTPDQRWAASDAYIIGGGPSLRGFDFARLKGKNTIGCNSAFYLGHEIARVCFFSDYEWFLQHYDALSDYDGEVFTHHEALVLHPDKWLNVLRRYDDGLHLDGLGFGGNSGCSAINLALLMGARRIFLLGIDCGGETHHWHNHDPGSAPKEPAELYGKFKDGFHAIARDMPELFPDRQIINLNPNSALRIFPFGDVDSVL